MNRLKRGLVPQDQLIVYRALTESNLRMVKMVSDNAVISVEITPEAALTPRTLSIPLRYFFDDQRGRIGPGMTFEILDSGDILDYTPTGYLHIDDHRYLCHDETGFQNACHAWGGEQDAIESPGTFPCEVRFHVDATHRIGYRATSIPDLAAWLAR